MPRHADPDLEKRVLDAAQKLWRGGGDKTLSMRKLARAARTNTPAIYRRFKNRKDLLRALLLRRRQETFEELAAAPTLEAAFERYIDFALRGPREYELYYGHQYELLRPYRPGGAASSEEITPTFMWVQRKLAERLGGSPEEHAAFAVAFWALAHGTASLLISRAVSEELAAPLRAAAARALAVLLREAEDKAGKI
jgi:AcrR family transcriptional regulator